MADAIRLYLDEDSGSQRLVSALRDRGVDVLTAGDAGRLRMPDIDQLTFAASTGRAIVTANQGDYARLHTQWIREGRSHAGIIIRTRQRMRPEDQAVLLLQLMARVPAGAIAGNIVFLGAHRP